MNTTRVVHQPHAESIITPFVILMYGPGRVAGRVRYYMQHVLIRFTIGGRDEEADFHRDYCRSDSSMVKFWPSCRFAGEGASCEGVQCLRPMLVPPHGKERAPDLHVREVRGMPSPFKLRSNTGLNAAYQGPHCLSRIGRISTVQVSVEKERC